MGGVLLNDRSVVASVHELLQAFGARSIFVFALGEFLLDGEGGFECSECLWVAA